MGNPMGFHLTPGQANDLDNADVLLAVLDADALLADKSYDAAERVLQRLEAKIVRLSFHRKRIGKCPVVMTRHCTKLGI